MPNGLEIEKKYLIVYPDTELLKRLGATEKRMEQTYLASEESVSERVRMSETNGVAVYTHTRKKKVKGIVRQEEERTISKAEYDALLERKEPGASTIKKTRYVLPLGGLVWEFDVFPFWQDKAFLEVELEREDQEVVLPDFVTVVADVSENPSYTNHALARRFGF